MIDNLISRLHKVQKKGDQRWVACCPAHDDKNPSLAVTELGDGKILIKCFAGCAPADVLNAVGLTMGDLFPGGALGHKIKGWVQLQKEMEQKKQKPLEREKLILEMADHDRKNGQRLSEKDLERERQAFMRLRNANHNG